MQRAGLVVQARREGAGDRCGVIMTTGQHDENEWVMVRGKNPETSKYRQRKLADFVQVHFDRKKIRPRTQSQGTQDWHVARRFHITSSVVSQLMLKSEEKNERKVEQADIILNSFLKPVDSEHMSLGLWNEPRALAGIIEFISDASSRNTEFPIPKNIDTVGFLEMMKEPWMGDSPDFYVELADGTVEVGEIKTHSSRTTVAGAIQQCAMKDALKTVEFDTDECAERVPSQSHRLQLLHHATVNRVKRVWYVQATTSEIIRITRVCFTKSQRKTHLQRCKENLQPHLAWAYEQDPVPPEFDKTKFGWLKDRATLRLQVALWLAWRRFETPPPPVKSFKSLPIDAWNLQKGGVDVHSSILAKISRPGLRLPFTEGFVLRVADIKIAAGVRLWKIFEVVKDPSIFEKLSIRKLRAIFNALGSFRELCGVLADDGVNGIIKSAIVQRWGIVNRVPIAPKIAIPEVPIDRRQLSHFFGTHESNKENGHARDEDIGTDVRLSRGPYERFTHLHQPIRIPINQGEARKQRRCFLCSPKVITGEDTSGSDNKKTSSECAICKVSLCTKVPKGSPPGTLSCFSLFHSLRVISRGSRRVVTDRVAAVIADSEERKQDLEFKASPAVVNTMNTPPAVNGNGISTLGTKRHHSNIQTQSQSNGFGVSQASKRMVKPRRTHSDSSLIFPHKRSAGVLEESKGQDEAKDISSSTIRRSNPAKRLSL